MLKLSLQQDGRGQKSDGVGDRHTDPYAQRAKQGRQDEQPRQQEEHLARQGEEDRLLRHANRKEEVGRYHLEAHQGEDREHDAQAIDRLRDQVGVGGKHPDNPLRHKLAEQKAQRGNAHTAQHREAGDLQHTRVEPSAIVVAGDWLHALVEAQDDHHEEEGDAVDNAVGTNSHIAAMLF